MILQLCPRKKTAFLVSLRITDKSYAVAILSDGI